MFAPVVEFTTARGEKVQFISSTASTAPSHMVGDAVDVIYDPNAPRSAEINTFWSLWFVPMLLGMVFTLIGVILFWLFLKESRRALNLN